MDRTTDRSVGRVVVVLNRRFRHMQVTEAQDVIAILVHVALGCRIVFIVHHVTVGVGSFRATRNHSLGWHAIWRSAIYDCVVFIYLLGVCGRGADILDHLFV